MVRAVITGRLLLSNGTVYGCGRLGINRHQSVTYSLSAAKCWWKARFSDVPFRLSLLLAHYIGDRPSRTEILGGTSNIDYHSLIVCLIGFRTSQFGFIPANLVCICVYAFSIRSWLRKPNTHRVSGLSVASGATSRPTGRAVRHLQSQHPVSRQIQLD
jgi:hypothetical protein